MIKIGDYVVLKHDLVLGRKYGTVTFGKYHIPYLHKLLRVYKISSTMTVYCSYNGIPCDCGTFSEGMLNISKFKVFDTVKIVKCPKDRLNSCLNVTTTIKSIECNKGVFIYRLDWDCGFYEWEEFTLEYVENDLKNLQPILKDENKLQREDSNLRSGERVQGSRVHGRKSQASICSRPLRDPSRIRGK